MFTLSPLLSSEHLSLKRHQEMVPESSARTNSDNRPWRKSLLEKLLNTDDEIQKWFLAPIDGVPLSNSPLGHY